jgi:hypothetical protein
MTDDDDNVDILTLHNDICLKFETQKNNINILEQRLQDLISIQNNKYSNELQTEIDMLQDNILNIKEQKEFNFYLLQVNQLIEDYKKELNKPISISFMSKKSDKKKQRNKKIIEIKLNYLSIVKNFKYFPTKISNDNSVKCTNCLSDKIEQIDNIFICSQCAVEIDQNYMSFSYKDAERVNIVSKYTYDRRIHFRDCINQFQGKQNSTIDQVVYDVILEKCRSHNLIDDSAPTLEQKFRKLTKQHIYMFLKDAKFNKHYEDIKLIHHNLTGLPIDNISHLEENLMKDFDILSNLYDQKYIQTKKISRKNFIHTQYVLFQLLKRHGYPCSKDDFEFLKTSDRQILHDDICSDLFNQLEWSFHAVF